MLCDLTICKTAFHAICKGFARFMHEVTISLVLHGSCEHLTHVLPVAVHDPLMECVVAGVGELVYRISLIHEI